MGEEVGITQVTDAELALGLGGPVLSSEEEKLRNEALRVEVRAVQAQRGCPLTEIAREIGISYSTFSAWLAGTYAGRVRTYDDKVEVWLKNRETAKRAQAALPAPPPFTLTAAARRFIAAFEHAQHAPDLAVISGAAGVGKTTAALAYRAQAPNVWLLDCEPCISTPRMILDSIAEKLGVSEGRSTPQISRAIVSRMRGTRGLLIVDEAQALNIQTLEQLRRLHDLAEIGMVFVGNERVQTRIEVGARTPEFAQLFSRVGMRVPRPRATKEDIEMLLDAWGVQGEPERKLLAFIARQPGALRSMTKVLRIATMHATAAGEGLAARYIEMGWEHLSAQKLDAVA